MRYLVVAILCWMICAVAIASAENYHVILKANKTTVERAEKDGGNYQAVVVAEKELKSSYAIGQHEGVDVVYAIVNSKDVESLKAADEFLADTYIGLVTKYPKIADEALEFEPDIPIKDKDGNEIKRGKVSAFRDKDGNLPKGTVMLPLNTATKPYEEEFNFDGSIKKVN